MSFCRYEKRQARIFWKATEYPCFPGFSFVRYPETCGPSFRQEFNQDVDVQLCEVTCRYNFSLIWIRRLFLFLIFTDAQKGSFITEGCVFLFMFLSITFLRGFRPDKFYFYYCPYLNWLPSTHHLQVEGCRWIEVQSDYKKRTMHSIKFCAVDWLKRF